ncbi:pentapeptide repeat-containing protein [Kordia antarctica]|uniref:pentapeptide repeat-containing protein n=1 Tax=Kordia antarctica TaxID=1218801 RepID=UPI0013569EA8|nr:pentapeptide repeat-containing protein [Kordia antarctica]
MGKEITEATFEWVEKLASSNDVKISDEDFKKLENDYFRGNKNNWFSEIEDDEPYIDWDKEKCKIFWELIRKYCMPRGEELGVYLFSGYIFPSFDGFNFFSFEKEFKYRVDFSDSYFLGGIFIAYTLFKSDVLINNCKFYSNSFFLKSEFEGKLTFKESFFKDKLEFEENIFSNNKTVLFRNVQFEKAVGFYKSEFLNETAFKDCVFHNDFLLLDSIISKKMFFIDIEFEGNNSFINLVENPQLIFDNCYKKIDINLVSDIIYSEVKMLKQSYYNYSYKNVLSPEGFINYYEKLSYKNEQKYPHFLKKSYKDRNKILKKFFLKEHRIKNIDIYFKGINLNNSIFRRMDMSNSKFYDTFFYKTIFEKCTWGLSNRGSRIKLYEENDIINKKRGFLPLEEQYRQLKKNFEDSKDWELSSKAYYSEMEMRFLRYKKEYKLSSVKSNIVLLLFWIYKFFGGYLQSYVRPFFFLILSTFIIFPIIYGWSDTLKEIILNLSNGKPFQMSIDATVAFYSFEYENHWGLYRIQSFISVILITFFILALRKRFK